MKDEPSIESGCSQRTCFSDEKREVLSSETLIVQREGLSRGATGERSHRKGASQKGEVPDGVGARGACPRGTRSNGRCDATQKGVLSSQHPRYREHIAEIHFLTFLTLF